MNGKNIFVLFYFILYSFVDMMIQKMSAPLTIRCVLTTSLVLCLSSAPILVRITNHTTAKNSALHSQLLTRLLIPANHVHHDDHHRS